MISIRKKYIIYRKFIMAKSDKKQPYLILSQHTGYCK